MHQRLMECLPPLNLLFHKSISFSSHNFSVFPKLIRQSSEHIAEHIFSPSCPNRTTPTTPTTLMGQHLHRSQGVHHASKQIDRFVMNAENEDAAHIVCRYVQTVTFPLHVKDVNVDCGFLREYTTRNGPIVCDENLGPDFVNGRLERWLTMVGLCAIMDHKTITFITAPQPALLYGPTPAGMRLEIYVRI